MTSYNVKKPPDLRRGYPTPDTPATLTFTTRCVPIPDIPEFVALIGGLLFEATQSHFWIEAGSMSIEDCITAMQDALGTYEADTECCMSCEDIIDCIENNPATGFALQQWLTNNGYGTGSGTYDEPTIYNLNPILADGSFIEGCNDDNLFGAITQLVDFMNDILTDIFERVEAGSNYLERTQLLVQGMPAIGLLPIDEFIGFADNVIGAIAENYASQYTTEIRDAYRCDLFCLTKGTCELDFQQWADYFMSQVGEVITTENFSDAVEWFITGVWEGTQVVHAAHALMCNVLAYGSEFFELDMAYLGRVITSSMNDPDGDWITLCEDCPPDFPIPEIVSNCWDSTSPGENLTHIGGTRWSIEVTHRTTPVDDYAFSIGAVGGGAFRLENIEFPGLVTPFSAAWLLENDTCDAGFYGASPDPSTTALKDLTYTWAIDNQYMEFDMVAP